MLKRRSHTRKLLKLAESAVENYAHLFTITYKTNKDKNNYNTHIIHRYKLK